MDSNERDLFSQFERQPYVDLRSWRQELVAYTDSRLAVAEEELRKYAVGTLTPEAHEVLLNTVMSHLVRAYMGQIEPVVRPGDALSAKGNLIYDILNRNNPEPDSEWLEEGSELQGRFLTITIKDYLDEEILDVDASELTEAFVDIHIRHFGVHLVLTDPVKIMPDGSEHSIPDCEALFVPLMYNRLDLTGHLSWDK